jgi:hypothetical protein
VRLRSLAVNILLPAGIAVAVVAVWVWWTGSATMPVPVGVGLALIAGGVSVAAERLIEVAVRRRSRSGPARHRRKAV